MLKTSDNKAVRLNTQLLEILNKIIDQEKKRGRDRTSYADAGDILAKRIEIAGGLKE